MGLRPTDENAPPAPKPVERARRLDRHRGFVVRRRAQYIGERHADLVAEVRDTPNWQNAPTKPRLVRRVESELEHAEAYIRKKLGNPLEGGDADA